MSSCTEKFAMSEEDLKSKLESALKEIEELKKQKQELFELHNKIVTSILDGLTQFQFNILGAKWVQQQQQAQQG